MIEIKEKKDCCGCSACAQICPKNSITMKADDEGFLYPSVNKDTCVNCGLCEKICPVLNKPASNQPLATYAAKHKDTEVKLKSSSGGMFTALAEYILKQGGVVFGAAFDKDWQVSHQWAENLEALDKLRRSKYVQSDINGTYKKAEDFLKAGRQVLFTGTPCQIAGLKNYLRKDYNNLLTADIICHGVPSPAVWAKFLKENFDVFKIKAINFREKRIAWNTFYLSFLLDDGLLYANGKKKTFLEFLYDKLKIKKRINWGYYNAFFVGFLYELINRISCHNCVFRGKRFADFSLGDLWGKWPEIISAEDEKYGVSLVTVNTKKAKLIFTQLPITVNIVDYDRAAKVNFPLETSPKAHLKHNEFFKRYKTEHIDKLVFQLLGMKPLWKYILTKIVNKIRKKL